LHLTKAPDYSTLTQLKETTRAIDLELILELPESHEKSSPKSLVSLSDLVDANANLAKCQKLNASFSICDDNETNIMLSPNHFIQVNAKVNIDMLKTAKHWLSLTKNDTLVDLFAGLGNFSLHFANDVKQCIAAEGVAEMVELGKQNAALNGLSNVLFKHVDLSDIGAFNELNIPENSTFIIDPARQGALELMQVFSKLKPKRILYVSCNPVSFAKDVNCLDEKYQIKQIKALDMFPFTEHIEMMALLERV
jgi:23S rRNA (uracil1939-C5)-methyltransferase